MRFVLLQSTINKEVGSVVIDADSIECFMIQKSAHKEDSFALTIQMRSCQPIRAFYSSFDEVKDQIKKLIPSISNEILDSYSVMECCSEEEDENLPKEETIKLDSVH